MDLWSYWLEGIRSVLHFLASDLGVGVGLGIIALTIVVRCLLLPLSWSVAYRGCIRQKKMIRLQPQFRRLKEACVDDPSQYAERLRELYAKNGMTLVDGRGILGILLQSPIFLGLYQTLRTGADGIRFLWIANLAKPDLWLALIFGATTALMMSVNPDLPENLRPLLIIVPAVLALLTALKFCSALALYWAVSNCFSATQTFLVHALVSRRINSGTISI
jgi:YidC/Oxa1 family membrane protein insertase